MMYSYLSDGTQKRIKKAPSREEMNKKKIRKRRLAARKARKDRRINRRKK